MPDRCLITSAIVDRFGLYNLCHGTGLAGRLLAFGYPPGILVVGFGYTLFGHPLCTPVMLPGDLAAQVLDRMVLAR
jgi:hypothetical protein